MELTKVCWTFRMQLEMPDKIVSWSFSQNFDFGLVNTLAKTD